MLVLVGGAAAGLVPWTVYLSLVLPSRYDTGLWRWSWVGFDVALVCCFGAAAWLGWRRRRAAVAFMIVTGALLCCDAWFDVTLDWGAPGMWVSLAMALLVELPIAAVLLARSRNLISGGLPARTFTVADIEIATTPEYRRLCDTLTTAGPATTAELATRLSLDARQVQPLLGRLATAGQVRLLRDGRWRTAKQNLLPPELDTVPEADRTRLRAFYDAKYQRELQLFNWAAQHRDEFGSWAHGARAQTYLTEEELRAFDREYHELVTRYALLHDAPNPDTRAIAIRWYAFPAPETGRQAGAVPENGPSQGDRRWGAG